MLQGAPKAGKSPEGCGRCYIPRAHARGSRPLTTLPRTCSHRETSWGNRERTEHGHFGATPSRLSHSQHRPDQPLCFQGTAARDFPSIPGHRWNAAHGIPRAQQPRGMWPLKGSPPSFGNHDWAQHLARGKTPAPIPAEESLPGDSGLQDREEVWDPGYRRHLPPPPSPKHPAASRARYPAPGKRRGPAGQRAQVAAAAGGTCEKGRGEREREVTHLPAERGARPGLLPHPEVLPRSQRGPPAPATPGSR